MRNITLKLIQKRVIPEEILYLVIFSDLDLDVILYCGTELYESIIGNISVN